MRLHEKLAGLRKRSGLSQMAVADRLDTTRQAVSKWENGLTAPATEKLAALCQLYQVTMDFLTDDSRDMAELDGPPMREPARPQPKPAEPQRGRRWLVAAAVLAALAVGIGAGALTMDRLHAKENEDEIVPLEEMQQGRLDPELVDGFSFEEEE